MSIKVVRYPGTVRKRPGMYVGELGPSAINQLIDEVVSNAIDQFVRVLATRVSVNFQDDGWIEITDDGPGPPFDQQVLGASRSRATDYLTNHHDAATADGAAPHIHLHARRGVGLCIVNALCSRFICRSWRNGACWEQAFAEGEAVANPCQVGVGDGRGSTFRFLPDAKLLQATHADQGHVRATLWRAAHLFCGMRLDCGAESFCTTRGVKDYLLTLQMSAFVGHPIDDSSTFHWRGEAGDFRVEAVAAGAARGRRPRTHWVSWVNGLETVEHGSHVDGFAQVLSALGWTPAVALLTVVAEAPRFASPMRDRFLSPEAAAAIRSSLSEPLQTFLAGQGVRR